MGGVTHIPNTPWLPNTLHIVNTCPHTHRYHPTPKWNSKRSHRNELKFLTLGKHRKSSNSIPSLKLLPPSWTRPLISPVSHHTCSSQCCPTPPATNWMPTNSTTRWTLIGNTNSITKWTPTNHISNTLKWILTLSINSTRRWTPISINSTIKWTLIPNSSSTLLANSKL